MSPKTIRRQAKTPDDLDQPVAEPTTDTARSGLPTYADRGLAAGVHLVAWPEHAELREQLAAERTLRVLVLDPEVAPPRALDLEEDWIRAPFEADDLEARVAGLVRRGDCGAERPVLDDGGLLWFRERWVAIPDIQLEVVRLLTDHLGQVVSTEDLEAAATARGASTNATAMKSLLRRVGERVREVDLDLLTVRTRGFLLDVPHACRLHPITGGVSAPVR